MKITMDQLPPENTMETAGGSEQPPKPLKQTLRNIRIACGVLTLLLAVAGVRTAGTIRSLNETIQKQEKTIEKLTDEVQGLESTDPGEETQETPETDRRTEDDRMAGELFQLLLTWDGYEDYASVRTALQETYGLPEDSALLTSFMPDVTEKEVGQRNMKFEKASTYRLGETDGQISYFGICSVSTRNENRDTGSGQVCVFYTLDKDGVFTDVSAYSMTSEKSF